MRSSFNYYKLLGVNRDATYEEIRKAYRQMALRYHPDRNPNMSEVHEKFKVIQEAYETLMNKEARLLYDNQLEQKYQAFMFRPGAVLNPHLIRARTKRRVVKTGKIFVLTITVYGPPTGYRVNGLERFQMVDEPEVETDYVFRKGVAEVRTNFTYKLIPKDLGYTLIGPAEVCLHGIWYMSHPVYLKVLDEEEYDSRFRRNEGWSWMLVAPVLVMLLAIGSWYWGKTNQSTVTLEEQISVTGSQSGGFDQLNTGDQPWAAVFPPAQSDASSMNKVAFRTGSRDAIVMLVNSGNDQVVRHDYIRSFSNYEMTHIPDGDYYLKVAFGNDWDPANYTAKILPGGFSRDRQLRVFDEAKYQLEMKQYYEDGFLHYAHYELTLYAVDNGNMSGRTSTSEEFISL